MRDLTVARSFLEHDPQDVVYLSEQMQPKYDQK